MKTVPSERRIFWQFFFGSYCVGLDRLLPIRAVSCLDYGSELDLISRQTGIQFCTVESPAEIRENWIGSGIDVVVERRKKELEQLLSSRPAADWCVTSSPGSRLLESCCDDRELSYYGSKAEEIARFQGKRALQSALRTLGLPSAKGQWLSRADISYAELRRRFGERFVVQKERGAAGSGTFLATSQGTLQAALEHASPEDLLVSPYLGDLSLNINAAVVEGEICVGFPNLQLSGVRELGAPWGGYCGNDYSSATRLGSSLIQVIQEYTERIGCWLAADGFEGLFGLDYVIGESDGIPYAVDLNPRWQGSTVISTQAEQRQGRFPLAAAEMASRIGMLSRSELKNSLDQFRKPITGAQLCLRFCEGSPCVVPLAVEPGIYQVGEIMEFARHGIRLSDCLSPDQLLLTCGAPRRGTVVKPGAWLVRVLSNESLSGGSSSQLNARGRQAAGLTYQLFGLRHPD